MYYLAKVKYQKIDESGKDKKVNGQYLFKAVGWGDAENQAYRAFEEMAINDFEIKHINPYTIADVNHFEFDGSKWFKCTYNITTIDGAPTISLL